ncbi:MAG: hypothetical protein AAGI46_03790 [Planctomycetota bacterium]
MFAQVSATSSDATPLVAAALLLGATIASYLAVRATHDAGRSRGPASLIVPGVLPATLLSLAAAWVGLPDLAMTLPIALAVACMTLVAGLALINQPDSDSNAPDDLPSSAGVLLLPAALAALVVVQGGAMATLDLGLLAACGVAVLVAGARRALLPAPIGWVQVAAAGLLTVAGGWLAWHGAGGLDVAGRPGGQALTGMILVGPMLAVPLIRPAINSSSNGSATGTLVALAMTAGLLVTLIPALVAGMLLLLGETVPASPRLSSIDLPILAVVSLLTLPAMLGRWRLGPIEGLGLVVLFVAYLVLGGATSR